MTKRILVATDFSTRSDRALRRAIYLAKSLPASLSLVHVIDEDQPKRLVDAQVETTGQLLQEQVDGIREMDGIDCDWQVIRGGPGASLGIAAKDLGADLLVLGPHRQQTLKDVFFGTTAERTMRTSTAPILTAKGVPNGSYKHVLLAIDMSDCSSDAIEVFNGLGIGRSAAISLVHVFDAAAATMMTRTAVAREEISDYVNDEKRNASVALLKFLENQPIDPGNIHIVAEHGSVAATIATLAAQISADLIVVGTRGRNGAKKLFLGSVAEKIIGEGECDTLAVPPSERSN
ncbi:hypothetical protein ACO34A_27025 (plasmid) [Rhizobium sp. ACO-34A]|nr:universal stress protein [Rhizobium sp. ACO-34A]ATN37424.1 hypothetical protein ACO34A_27025 [Rhizobium sp. ACO-34A]